LLIAESDLGETVGYQSVTVGGRVLVDHRHRWGCMAEAAHEIGKRRARLSGEHGARVAEVVEFQVVAACRGAGGVPRSCEGRGALVPSQFIRERSRRS